MDRIDKESGMHYEGMCIRPPSEAQSILLQATVSCSHNNCTFCGSYKDKRFRIKDNDIILSDILFASRYMQNQQRLFIMDGDALIIPFPRLIWILERIREYLPWVKRVGVYANTKGIKMKSEGNHASNYLPVKARLPKGKRQTLDLIDMALQGKVDLRPELMRAL